MSEILSKGVAVSAGGIFTTLTTSIQNNNIETPGTTSDLVFFNIHNNEDYYTFLGLPGDAMVVYDQFGIAHSLSNGAFTITSDPFTSLASNADGTKLLCYQAVTDSITIYDLTTMTATKNFITGQAGSAVATEALVSFCDDETNCMVYRNNTDDTIYQLADDGTLVGTIALAGVTIISMLNNYGMAKTLVAQSDGAIAEIDQTTQVKSDIINIGSTFTNTPLSCFNNNRWLINTTSYSPVIFNVSTSALEAVPVMDATGGKFILGHNGMVYGVETSENKLITFVMDYLGDYHRLDSNCYFSGNTTYMGCWLGKESRKVSVTIDMTGLTEPDIYLETFDSSNRLKRNTQKIDSSNSSLTVDIFTGDTNPIDIVVKGKGYNALSRGMLVYLDELYVTQNTLQRLKVTKSGLTSLSTPVYDPVNPTTDGNAVLTPLGTVATIDWNCRLIPA